MTDDNHFDPIFLFTTIFPAVSDVSIDNSSSVLLLTAAVLRIKPSVGTKLPAVMEVSLQPSRVRPNHLAHQQFAFSSDFSLMPYKLSGFQFLEALKLEYLQIHRDLQLILLMLLLVLEKDQQHLKFN